MVLLGESVRTLSAVGMRDREDSDFHMSKDGLGLCSMVERNGLSARVQRRNLKTESEPIQRENKRKASR